MSVGTNAADDKLPGNFSADAPGCTKHKGRTIRRHVFVSV